VQIRWKILGIIVANATMDQFKLHIKNGAIKSRFGHANRFGAITGNGEGEKSGTSDDAFKGGNFKIGN
jgi:cobalt-zinc-cadmium resistance protein CzcA